MQLWFDLSDGAAEDALHDVLLFRKFTDILKYVPDRTTIMNSPLFSGETLCHGVIIDATIISAPCSIKNKYRQRDLEMHQTRKGNQWYFGMKAHIVVDTATGLTEKVVIIAANEHDLNAADRLITAPVEVVFADAGYRGAEKRDSLLGRVKYWFIASGPHAVKKIKAAS